MLSEVDAVQGRRPDVFAPMTAWYSEHIEYIVDTVWAVYRDSSAFEAKYWRFVALSAVIVYAPQRVRHRPRALPLGAAIAATVGDASGWGRRPLLQDALALLTHHCTRCP
jgi:hypothetical protein